MLFTLGLLVGCDSLTGGSAGGGGGGGGGGASDGAGYRGALRQREGGGTEAEPAPDPKPTRTHPTDTNVLLIVLDDVGTDKVRAYGLSDSAPPTPSLSKLAEQGRVFQHAWVQPMCSPTRAAMMTGRYPRRTGVGFIIDWFTNEPELAETEISIPEMLEKSKKNWTTSFVGKWHLNSQLGQGVPRAPQRQGFDWYNIIAGNVREGHSKQKNNGEGMSYEHWQQIHNGEPKDVDGYVLRQQADDAIARIDTMPEPWFLWTAFTGVHVPLAPPPKALYGDLGVNDKSSDLDLYDAVLRALDVEVGRIVNSLTAEQRAKTTIIVISDNGTPDDAIRPPLRPNEGKGSVMELGVRVPLIVTGPLVEEPGPSDALVASVDVFATIADVAGVDVGDLGVPIDGVSFYSSLKKPKAPGARETVYTEKFIPNGDVPHTEDKRAIRDSRWKLMVEIKDGVETERFFDMSGVDLEPPNLLRDGKLGPLQQEAYDRLRAQYDAQMASFGNAGGGGGARPGLPMRAKVP